MLRQVDNTHIPFSFYVDIVDIKVRSITAIGAQLWDCFHVQTPRGRDVGFELYTSVDRAMSRPYITLCYVFAL